MRLEEKNVNTDLRQKKKKSASIYASPLSQWKIMIT